MQLEKRVQPAAVQLLDDFSFYKKEVISSSLLKDASPYLLPLAQHKGELEFMKPKVTVKGLTWLAMALMLTPSLPACPDLCPGTESSWELRSMQGMCGALHFLWAQESLLWQYLGADSVSMLSSRKRWGQITTCLPWLDCERTDSSTEGRNAVLEAFISLFTNNKVELEAWSMPLEFDFQKHIFKSTRNASGQAIHLGPNTKVLQAPKTSWCQI